LREEVGECVLLVQHTEHIESRDSHGHTGCYC
jgi:hypothetical protein